MTPAKASPIHSLSSGYAPTHDFGFSGEQEPLELFKQRLEENLKYSRRL